MPTTTRHAETHLQTLLRHFPGVAAAGVRQLGERVPAIPAGRL